MLTSLSKHRILKTSERLGTFEVYKSKNCKVVTQYYIVPSDWEQEATRVEPLAHINKLKDGSLKYIVWQPERFQTKEDIAELAQQVEQ